MRTIILPGYSLKNKDWAEQMRQELSSQMEIIPYWWNHWENPEEKSDWDKEAEGIVGVAKDEEVNILAKSIGTYVSMLALAKGLKINKLILCGVPVLDFQEGDDKPYLALKDLPSEKVLCVQNENDNHGAFPQVEKFLQSINPGIKIVSKPRDDHEYYYSEDFKSFLASKS